MYTVIDITSTYGFVVPTLVLDLLIVGTVASVAGAIWGFVWWTAQDMGD